MVDRLTNILKNTNTLREYKSYIVIATHIYAAAQPLWLCALQHKCGFSTFLMLSRSRSLVRLCSLVVSGDSHSPTFRAVFPYDATRSVSRLIYLHLCLAYRVALLYARDASDTHTHTHIVWCFPTKQHAKSSERTKQCVHCMSRVGKR